MKTLLAFFTVSLVFTLGGFAQSTQPTPSMQEQYDKLHGTAPKKTDPKKTTTKPQTTQKPAKTTTASKPSSISKPQTAAKPKATTESDGAKFRVGVRGGANYCTYNYPNTTTASPESIIGFHGGLIANIGGERFSVQPEVLYSQIGAKVSTTILNQTIKSEAKINTVTVPVLLKLALGSQNFKFFVNAGGYGSYAINGNTKSTINGNVTNQKVEFNGQEGRIEYGAVGGAGISLGLGPAKLLIEGRYYYGLGNNAKDIPNVSKYSVRNIQGSIGILIPLGGK